MNLHDIPTGGDTLVLFLRARWTDYEIERVAEHRIRYRPRTRDFWDRMEANTPDGDYAYYSRLALRWDQDGRPRDAKTYW